MTPFARLIGNVARGPYQKALHRGKNAVPCEGGL